MAQQATHLGDTGTTALADGQRVPKNDCWVEAYGTLDELGSCLGLARGLGLAPELDALVLDLQRRLGALETELAFRGAAPGGPLTTGEQSRALDEVIERLGAQLPPLHGFIVPGGHPAAAALHVARAVCRRAERRLLDLADVFPARAAMLQYVNRLSLALFHLARRQNQVAGFADQPS